MNLYKGLKLGLATVLMLLIPMMVSADALDTGDTAWILTSTALVLFMTLPGLALFYGGLVRAKNVLSVLMQCFVIACIVSILWVVYGYSLSFGDGGSMNAFKWDIARKCFCHVPDDLCDYYTSVDHWWFCRTYEIFSHAAIQCYLGQCSLFPGMPLGVGWWLAG